MSATNSETTVVDFEVPDVPGTANDGGSYCPHCGRRRDTPYCPPHPLPYYPRPPWQPPIYPPVGPWVTPTRPWCPSDQIFC